MFYEANVKNGAYNTNGTFLMIRESANRLKAARKAKGLSQRDMANKLGCGLRTYSRYETSDSRIPEKRLSLIAVTLGVSESWLSGGHSFDRYEIPEDLTLIWDRIMQIRGAVEEEYVPGQWEVDMDNVLRKSGYHPELDEDEKRRLRSTPDSFLNVRIDSDIRDRIHEIAALTGLPIQEMVKLAWCVFEESLADYR